MSDYDVPLKSWVIACDGAKALFMRNDGDVETLDLKVVDQFGQPDLPDRDIAADRPGRTYQSMGDGRSAMENTDFHEQAEADFLKGVAGKLNEKVASKAIGRFLLVAPPRAIGILRPQLSEAATTAMSAEIQKDLVKMPVVDLQKHLAALRSA